MPDTRFGLRYRGGSHKTLSRAAGLRLSALAAALLACNQAARAIDIPDVQPVAWDQPQIYAALVRNGGAPLMDGLLGNNHFTAFLDTGASGSVLSPFFSGELGFGVAASQCDGSDIVFSDYAVGGSVNYNVAEPLEVRLAAFQPHVVLNDADAFDVEFNLGNDPLRLQLGPLGSGTTDNVIGMPAMVGRSMVVDTRAIDRFLLDSRYPDQLHTYLYPPGTGYSPDTSETDPGIPQTDVHVALTLVDVSRFTRRVPGAQDCPLPDPGAESVNLAANPFIGPNPLAAIDPGITPGPVPGVTISRQGGLSASGSFLLDTGAAFSFISTGMAAHLQVRYRQGTQGTASPVLETFDPNDPGTQGVALPDQFIYGVSGMSGAVTVAGFYLDELLLKTNEGNVADPDDPAHLRYLEAPVVVHDIALLDPDPAPGNGDTLVLDGIIGMNMLVASALLDDNPLLPSILDQRLSPFEWIVFDEGAATLGFLASPSIDGDADDDGVPDFQDICPLVYDPDQDDGDLDLAGDACDALPADPSEVYDSDDDGTGDNADPDDDNDDIEDTLDRCPLVADPGQENGDGDPLGDVCDPDDDNDGIEDLVDAFPDDSAEYLDTDGDGIGNNADPDDDDDGLSDEFELANGLDPLDGAGCPRWLCPSGFSRGWRVILAR